MLSTRVFGLACAVAVLVCLVAAPVSAQPLDQRTVHLDHLLPQGAGCIVHARSENPAGEPALQVRQLDRAIGTVNADQPRRREARHRG